ncbi:biofilm matrix protein TasA [Bacillus pumilus]|uniref:Spore coat protein n=1 Tax=Bacillus pumilus (strain SAFR-032) TaxID=315750 RepID=A8FF46_BACP2|nr:TasA family protein [Bacillus pumilus]ABV62863.1 spore coat protein [Bacillus pumilus SAFR-032]MBC3641887.1 spore coat protein [Bacillus pumilus]MBC3645008.1 spore coat protein [Bacillus pumilus]MBC3649541.1 spore coat protein [Bacillus pumilus]MBC3652976.1 spore coat protein [Bacillus pumilus]
MAKKRSIRLGVLSGALGLALIGGGTWAAFNDIETANAVYSTGELDLSAKENSGAINLSNLKPGDRIKKEFNFENKGSLAINQVLMSLDYSQYQDGASAKKGGKNTAEEFLSQFQVSVLTVGAEGGNGYPKNIILDAANLLDLHQLTAKQDQTAFEKLRHAVDEKFLHESGKINVATVDGTVAPEYDGIPKNPFDYDKMEMIIEFVNDQTKDKDGHYIQNKYQGDAIQIDLSFEATQWNGLTINPKKHTDEKGYVKENEKAHSEDKK